MQLMCLKILRKKQKKTVQKLSFTINPVFEILLNIQKHILEIAKHYSLA